VSLSVRTIVPILTYHNVAPGPGLASEEFTVRPEQLAEHLRYIVDRGYASGVEIGSHSETYPRSTC